jgi:hypothetical protein
MGIVLVGFSVTVAIAWFSNERKAAPVGEAKNSS